MPSQATNHLLPHSVSIDKRHLQGPRLMICDACIFTSGTMYACHILSIISSLLWLVHCSSSQDVQTFCNRLYHSIVVANDRLYVDGGELRTVSRTFGLNPMTIH